MNFIDGQKLRCNASILASDQIRLRQNGCAAAAQISGVADGCGNDDQARPYPGAWRFTLYVMAARLGFVINGPVRAAIGTVFAVRGTG